MMILASTVSVPCILFLSIPTTAQQPGSSKPDSRGADYGHSGHGEAYDEGPRQRPWKMKGIGKTNFKVTTDVPEVQVGDPVVVMGTQGMARIDAMEVAQWAGTIAYEITCGISKRVPRQIVGE